MQPSAQLNTLLAAIDADEIPFYEEDFTSLGLTAFFDEHQVDPCEFLAWHFKRDSVSATQAFLFSFPELWIELELEDWIKIGLYLSTDDSAVYHYSFWIAEILEINPELFWKTCDAIIENEDSFSLYKKTFPSGLSPNPQNAVGSAKKAGINLESIRKRVQIKE